MAESPKLESTLARDLRAADADAKLAIAQEWIGGRDAAFFQDAMDLIAGAPGAGSWCDALQENANSAYLRAKNASEAGDSKGACTCWERFFELQEQRDPQHLLAYARALADCDRFDEAALQLRRALEQRPRYAFFPRADRLVRRVGAKIDTHLREGRVAVLGNTTTSLLIPALRALLLRDRVKAEIYEGLYGSAEQEILNPEGGLVQFKPSIVFLPASWRDLRLPATVDDENSFVENATASTKTRWKRLSDSFGCHVVQHAYDFPRDEAFGYLGATVKGGRTRVIQLLNQRMLDEAPSYVSILDTPALQRVEGAAWQDDSLWHNYQQHPSSESLPALADLMAAHIRAVLGLTRKVAVMDLDNTLWAGVIGEDGLTGIKIGPGSAAGEAHLRLQQYLLDLKARGILLAVASKNNHEDATLPFLKHEHMLLRMEDFAAFEANWNDKAQSIRTIAQKLSLGLDSFVFIDDNPFERNWVRAQVPEVAIVDLGPSVFDYVRDLDRGRYFFSLALSAEDQARAEKYRDEAARKNLQATSDSLDDFLKQLQLRAWAAPIEASNIARVTQLTNKTNQFNLTTRRYTEGQVEQLAADRKGWTSAFHLADRMGEYGLIGIIFCRAGESAASWEIDTWLMSCRVLGRQMEKFMFDRLVEAAQSKGVREIIGVFKPTAKNGLVRDLYDQFGLARVSETKEETRYSLQVPSKPVETATHVRNMAEAVPQ